RRGCGAAEVGAANYCAPTCQSIAFAAATPSGFTPAATAPVCRKRCAPTSAGLFGTARLKSAVVPAIVSVADRSLEVSSVQPGMPIVPSATPGFRRLKPTSAKAAEAPPGIPRVRTVAVWPVTGRATDTRLSPPQPEPYGVASAKLPPVK